MPLVTDQTPAVASSSETPWGGLVMMAAFSAALIVVPLIRWRRQHRRHRDVPRSEHLKRAAEACSSIVAGVIFLATLLHAVLAEPGQSSSALIWVYMVLIYSAGALWLALAVLRAVERRKDRQLRKGMGLTVLRRRLHWGWFVVGWVIGFPFAASGIAWVVLMVLIGSGTLDLTSSRRSPSTESVMGVVFLVLYIGGAVVIGAWQAYRRRVRDRQIEDADLPVVDLARVNDNRPSPAIPTPVARAWRNWQDNLDAPVPPGEEMTVLLLTAVLHVGWLGAVVVMGASMVSTAPSPVLAVLGLLILALAAAFMYYVIAMMSTGARTAVRQLKSRPTSD